MPGGIIFPGKPGWARFIGCCFLAFLVMLACGSLLFDKIRGGIGNTDTLSFLNDRAADITGAAAVNASGFVSPLGLTGAGQIVAIADSGLDTGNMNELHPDLRSTPGAMPKVVLLRSLTAREVPDDPDGHGTHMAATIAGTGAASDGRFRGLAPEASIYFQSILNLAGEPELPADLADLFYPAYSAGARIHVNGWGGGGNTYGDSSAQIDGFVRDYFDFLPIFGVGNSGPAAGTITTESNSKNALTVGASILPRATFVTGSVDTAVQAVFSSRGPTEDGRIKPELLAPASAVISARSSLVEGNLPGFPDYTRMQGTSMATAVAGGSAALLREYLKEDLAVSTPSAALLKAALINGARTDAQGPSADGFGVIDLTGTVIALKEGCYTLVDEWGGVAEGNTLTYTYRVSEPIAAFKATLVWTDLAATADMAGDLVNDLDLIVRTPDGMIYHGNHFLGANRADRVNNVEQVYLPAPLAGDYTVQVVGASVDHNAVVGSAMAFQDFALVLGQAPLADVVENVGENYLTLTGGATVSLSQLPLTNLLDGQVVTATREYFFPGAQAYLTPGRTYLTARLWRAAGIGVLHTAEGAVFTEIHTASRLGGYSLPSQVETVKANGNMVKPSALPQGMEISAVINPVDQKIRGIDIVYNELSGVVAAIHELDGQRQIVLAGDGGTYPLTADAVFSYENQYQDVETADIPFSTGALDELEEVLPGMPVLLRFSPDSGAVQYVAVKRLVTLGVVQEIDPELNEILLQSGAVLEVLPGAPVKRDRETAEFNQIKPGDHITTVLMPDTGEAIGLVAYSNVVYGKVIDFIKKARGLYLLDNQGRYRSLTLDADAIVYRWGVQVQDETITTGGLVRAIIDREGKQTWRLDIGESFYKQTTFVEYNDAEGLLTAGDGQRYRISETAYFYKNGYRIFPEELRAGEWINLEYTVAPLPEINVLLSLNAHSVAAAPALFVSALPLQGQVLVNGRAGLEDSVYMWRQGTRQNITLDATGRFQFTLEQDSDSGYNLLLVALNKNNGGISGRELEISTADFQKVSYAESVDTALTQAVANRALENELSEFVSLPLTRLETVAALADLFNWPKSGAWPLTCADAQDIPAGLRSLVAEALARGIFQGYDDGNFYPDLQLSRAEAAMILAAVLQDLGLAVEPAPVLNYADADLIPDWAVQGVAISTAADLFRGRPDGTFAPGYQLTYGDMAVLMERLLDLCEQRLTVQGTGI